MKVWNMIIRSKGEHCLVLHHYIEYQFMVTAIVTTFYVGA
jgi:hypothetical protein